MKDKGKVTHVFLDTDIILDLITGRQPHAEEAAAIFTLIGHGRIKAYTSSLSFSNLYYVLRKYAPHVRVISRLSELCNYLEILNVDRTVVTDALRSKFRDFEDAIQCHSAQKSNVIRVIVTRNVKDYKYSEIPVMTPGSFLKTLGHERDP